MALAYDGLCTFEFGVAVEIFGLARPEMGDDWYRFRVAAIEPGPLRAMGGIRVAADGGLSLLEQAGTIIVPGWRGADQPVPARLIKRAAARARARRAAAVVLLGRVRAGGHRAARRQARDHALALRASAWPAPIPRSSVVPDVLYVDEGSLLTAAGSAAGIDLSLHLIRRDWGAAAANSVARRLVVPPHRDGGQAQFIEAPVPEAREGGRLGQVLDRMRAEPGRRYHASPSWRAHAGMSRRTFLRRFKASTGTTPGAWLAGARIARARELLADRRTEHRGRSPRPRASARRPTLRHHFRKQMKVSPSDYRRPVRAPVMA